MSKFDGVDYKARQLMTEKKIDALFKGKSFGNNVTPPKNEEFGYIPPRQPRTSPLTQNVLMDG